MPGGGDFPKVLCYMVAFWLGIGGGNQHLGGGWWDKILGYSGLLVVVPFRLYLAVLWGYSFLLLLSFISILHTFLLSLFILLDMGFF